MIRKIEMNSLKEKMFFFIYNFYPIDYLFFLGIFLLFIMVVCAVLLNRENMMSSLLMLFFALIMLIFISIFGYKVFDERVRPRKVEIITNQKMEFSNNVFLELSVTPEYKTCMINLKLVKNSSDYKQMIQNHLRPIYQEVFTTKRQTYIKKVIPNIKTKNYKVLLKTYCF